MCSIIHLFIHNEKACTNYHPGTRRLPSSGIRKREDLVGVQWGMRSYLHWLVGSRVSSQDDIPVKKLG
jgi:hypothetical protein